jgi:hypothetical protein
MISVVFGHFRRRLFLFGCAISLVNRWSTVATRRPHGVFFHTMGSNPTLSASQTPKSTQTLLI